MSDRVTITSETVTVEQSQQRTRSYTFWTTIAGIAWFLIGLGLYFWRFHFDGGNFHSADISRDGKDWGDFGVFIAGFSGTGIAVITLLAVAYGIRVQAEDLAKSRDFMAKQSKSMAEQSATMAKQFDTMTQQSETMAQQAFDSVFFNLLDRFSDVRDNVSIPIYMEKPVEGRDVPAIKEVFVKGRRAFEEFYQCIWKSQVGMKKADPNRITVLQNLFLGQYKLAESELGPYFRTLYQIFKWIDRATITDKQKIDYAKMARAQLSDLELSVLFYDGLTDMAVKMKPLIEKYGILKHVNPANLLQEDDKRNQMLYEPKAFE